LVNPQSSGWNVKKEGGDYDQFTGATITPRAGVKQVLNTRQYFEDDRERLLQIAAANAARENEQAAL
jgi:electron transport complex protein RnfG